MPACRQGRDLADLWGFKDSKIQGFKDSKFKIQDSRFRIQDYVVYFVFLVLVALCVGAPPRVGLPVCRQVDLLAGRGWGANGGGDSRDLRFKIPNSRFKFRWGV